MVEHVQLLLRMQNLPESLFILLIFLSENDIIYLTMEHIAVSTAESIRQHLTSLPLAQPVSSKEFMAFGRRAAVDQALTRLVQKGELSRVARGIYMRPKRSPYVGEVPPDPAKIAEVLASESGNRIQVHGAEAVRRMGLSTQAPSRPIFYTSGPSRHVRIGQMEVSLQHVSSRKLAMAERPAGIALTALWYLGKGRVTLETIERIRMRLPREEFEALRSSTRIMPGWMHDVFIRFEENQQHA